MATFIMDSGNGFKKDLCDNNRDLLVNRFRRYCPYTEAAERCRMAGCVQEIGVYYSPGCRCILFHQLEFSLKPYIVGGAPDHEVEGPRSATHCKCRVIEGKLFLINSKLNGTTFLPVRV